MTHEELNQLNRIVFVSLLVLLAWTRFSKEGYRSVEDIVPAVAGEPVQTEPQNPAVVTISRDGIDYRLTPLFDYELNALIVSRLRYDTWYSLKKSDSLYPFDLCVIWGGNAAGRVFQSDDLSFHQDMRQCHWVWTRDLGFNNAQAANVHLVVAEDGVEDHLADLSASDQVRLKGQLVAIDATNTSGADTYNPPTFQMRSSTVRTDSGPGACEILKVDEVAVLRKGHPVAAALYSFSFWSLILLGGANLGRFALWLFRG